MHRVRCVEHPGGLQARLAYPSGGRSVEPFVFHLAILSLDITVLCTALSLVAALLWSNERGKNHLYEIS